MCKVYLGYEACAGRRLLRSEKTAMGHGACLSLAVHSIHSDLRPQASTSMCIQTRSTPLRWQNVGGTVHLPLWASHPSSYFDIVRCRGPSAAPILRTAAHSLPPCSVVHDHAARAVYLFHSGLVLLYVVLPAFPSCHTNKNAYVRLAL